MTILEFLSTCGTFHPERDHLIVYKSLDDYLESSCNWVQLTDESLTAYVLSCSLDMFFVEERLHGYDFCLVLSQPRCFNTVCEFVREAIRNEK